MLDGGAGGGGPAGVIISPGPCTPAEAGVSAAIIERFAGRIPILGVCLGHQTLAALHHMPVERHTRPMHGKTSEIHHDGRGFFTGIPSPMVATRYHSLVVPVACVPPRAGDGSGWEISAWTDEPGEAGSAPQRVMMGLRRVWPPGAAHCALLEGVQFHPESFLTEHGPKLLANFLAATSARGVRS
jgi:anthranilate synthase/aminodeoxychorismate synthase-like glutamine amidotransferase